MLGGCCGTDAEFIRQIKATVKDLAAPSWKEEKPAYLSSERKVQKIDPDGPFLLIGERMNPTGKKALREELKAGSLSLLLSMAAEQEEMGAHILDLNVGMNGIDEKETMLRAIEELGLVTSLPLCIDTSHIDIMEAALRAYPGRALINSISYEKEKIEKALPLAKKYGAMFIALPLSEDGLPKNVEEKKAFVEKIINEAAKLGIPAKNIVVDGLVATVGAEPEAALNTLETIRYCKEELGVATVTGLSNISFGLPERGKVNGAFLTMAMSKGLTMAIANPSSESLQDAMYASSLLLCKPEADRGYIGYCQKQERKNKTRVKETEKNSEAVENTENKEPDKDRVYKAVLEGNRSGMLAEVEKELARGTKPGEIIDQKLIPAINQVGELFDQQIYFLPQLIASAEAMKKAIEYLEPMLSEESREELATIVIATVEGDIHDIGKNLVALMLKNYGFRVIDLGKNVPKETIVETAIEEKADFIVLSALMTTTMMEMKEVISHKKQMGCQAKVCIGGAVITQSFAEEIGADGYSRDAADAVRLIQQLLQ